MSMEDFWAARGAELLRTEASLATVLRCAHASRCLLREWLRRYGTAGSGCSCFALFHASIEPPMAEPDDD